MRKVSVGRKVMVGATTLSAVALMAMMTSPAFAQANVVRDGTGSVVAVHAVKHHGKKVQRNHDPVIYDSTVQPNPGNLASQSYEATATAQFGNQISFGGKARVLDNAVVQMSTWGCEQGGWSLPSPAAFPPAPANGNVVQQAPGSGATTSAGWSAFADQLNTTGGVGSVTFTTTASSPNVSVSSSGAVTTIGAFPGTGTYTVSGTDSDTPNSDTGVWSYTLDIGANPCLTTPGATFSEPVTLNIYNVGPANTYGPSTAGSLITSVTQTFNVPYRPSENDTLCTGTKAGAWYDAALNTCFHGYLTPITFSLGHVRLPNSIIYGIAYNTSDNGTQPYGRATTCANATDSYVSPATYDDCGYDSLNVALSQEPTAPGVGSDTYPGTVYWEVDQADYAVNEVCDAPGLAAGINVFRIDEPANYPTGDGTTSGCWSVTANHSSPWYVPAVQFNAVLSPAATINSANNATVVAGTPFSFAVTTTGVPVPTISEHGRLPHGLTFTNKGDGTATISGTALTSNRDRSYRLTLRATNLPLGGRNRQQFTLTLTGGRP
jgi:hypothetical protein